MYTILIAQNQNPRVNSVLSALKNIQGRFSIDAYDILLNREVRIDEFELSYLAKFNQGDTIYRHRTPYACINSPKELYRAIPNKKGLTLVNEWPEFLCERSHYLFHKKLGFHVPIWKMHGSGTRTKLRYKDFESWIAYWSICDIFRNSGIFLYGVDDRIPTRDLFLKAYNEDNWDQDFVMSNSKEEVQNEILSTMFPKYAPIRGIVAAIEEWINQNPFCAYRIYFNGPSIIVDRLSDLAVLTYYSQKENHPLFERLKEFDQN